MENKAHALDQGRSAANSSSAERLLCDAVDGDGVVAIHGHSR